jgi:hypothetical protein
MDSFCPSRLRMISFAWQGKKKDTRMMNSKDFLIYEDLYKDVRTKIEKPFLFHSILGFYDINKKEINQ